MESTKPYQDGMDIKKKALDFELLKKLSAKGIKIEHALLKFCKRLSMFLSLVFITNAVNAEAEMKSFTANFTGTKVRLYWKINSESNVNYYCVERSNDGKLFETVGMVMSSGNSDAPKQYSFIDKDYYNNAVYYRLKCMDNNKKEKALAGIIGVQVTELMKEIAIYPASYFPCKIYMDVSKINSSKIIAEATDADGQKLANKQVDKSQNENAVELKSSYLIQKGDYMLTAFFDNQIVKTRLYIKDASMNFSENNPGNRAQQFTLK